MDYFAKFRKRMAPPKAQPTSAMQLAKFHKCWDYVHNIFVVDDRKTNMHVEQTEIPERLRQMVDMLVEEEARQEDNTTGVCMEYFLKNGVLQYLVSMAEKADYPVGIRREAIRAITLMVELLDDRFLVHNAVHKPTVKLLRFCVLDDPQNDLYHKDLVDLMYNICSKIHGFPDLLNIFFHDKQWLTTPQKTNHEPVAPNDSTSGAAENKPEYEFLLFTYLLRFVHREGSAGDFARTGLLFLMEMAVNQLGDFILESDFATIMAAGLGALYSQLPRKLVIKDESELNVSASTYLLGQDLDPRAMPSGQGVEMSSSADFRYQLDSFLKLLEFSQDVLTRCPNSEISVRLLQSVQTIFLENILYPSILECSDRDGSAVAVISYVDLILQTVQQQHLADVVVGFLMDENDGEQRTPTTMRQPSVDHGQINMFAGIELDQFKSSPYFIAAGRFTLKDLIFSRLKSNSQPTVIATLKLLKTLITKHCKYAMKLLSTYPEQVDPNKEKPHPSMVISHHIREIELYLSLITAVDGANANSVISHGYEEYLLDMEVVIESDGCYQQLADLQGSSPRANGMRTPNSERRRSFKYGQRFDELVTHYQALAAFPTHTHSHLVRHRIRPTDTLLQILLGLLSHFFAQSSELNLALTGVISALAICPYRSLEGWIAFRESDRTTPDDILNLDAGEDATQRLKDLHLERDSIRASDIYARYDNTPDNGDSDDDDRSIDFGVERNSAKMTAPTQFKSFPPFFTLLRTLTQQVDYYRSEVEGFDLMLQERRNGLMTVDAEAAEFKGANMTPSGSASTRRGSIMPTSMNGAATLLSSNGLLTPSNSLTASMASPSSGGLFSRRPSVLRPSASTGTSGSVLMPSKSLSSSTTAGGLASSFLGTSVHPPVANTILTNPLSPLAIHARKAQSIRIQPLFPSNFVSEQEEPILDLDVDDEDTFAPKATNPSQTRRMDKNTEITLAMLLNNVVILEETIKELVAIMQVRRSLGIDEIRYTSV